MHNAKTIHAKYLLVNENTSLIQIHDAHNIAEEKLLALNKNLRAAAAKKLIKARKRAFCLGYKSGAIAAEKEFLSRALSARELYVKSLKEASHDALSLTLSITEEILGEAINQSHKAIALRIAEALNSLLDLKGMKILVHPAAQNKIELILASYTIRPDTLVVPSEQISLGCALIETPFGSIEINVWDHFEAIKTKLTEIHESKLSEIDHTGEQNGTSLAV